MSTLHIFPVTGAAVLKNWFQILCRPTFYIQANEYYWINKHITMLTYTSEMCLKNTRHIKAEICSKRQQTVEEQHSKPIHS